jgi:hypothetical protein
MEEFRTHSQDRLSKNPERIETRPYIKKVKPVVTPPERPPFASATAGGL